MHRSKLTLAGIFALGWLLGSLAVLLMLPPMAGAGPSARVFPRDGDFVYVPGTKWLCRYDEYKSVYKSATLFCTWGEADTAGPDVQLTNTFVGVYTAKPKPRSTGGDFTFRTYSR